MTVDSHVTWFTNELTTTVPVQENLAATHFVYRVNHLPVCDSIHYTIQSGNEDGMFYIDTSGRIYTNGSLDYEKNNQYNLTVRALYKDTNGDYTVQATPDDTWVNVTVSDVNEAPFYRVHRFIQEICIDPATGEEVARMNASDHDNVQSIGWLDSIYSLFS